MYRSFTIALPVIKLTTFALFFLASPARPSEPNPALICDLESDTVKSCEHNTCLWMATDLGLPATACTDEDSLKDAAKAKEKSDLEEATTGMAREARRALNAKNTSTGTPASQGQSVTDFLSKLAISRQSDTGGDEESFRFELGDFLGLPTNDGYRLTAELRETTVFDMLLKKFPEEVRATRQQELSKKLGDLDDVLVAFSYSPVTQRLGRNWKPHDPLWDALFESVKARIEAESKAASKASDAQTLLLEDVAEAFPDLSDAAESGELRFSKLASLNPQLATDLRAATVASQLTWHRRSAALDAALDESHFLAMADLIDNQPQLNLTASWSFRDPLVGPESGSAKIAYEHGFVNVRRLRRKLGECLGRPIAQEVRTLLKPPPTDSPADGQPEAENTQLAACYKSFFSPEILGHLQSGDRLAVGIEYTDTEDYAIVLPDAQLQLNGSTKLTGSLAYGRYLRFDASGAGQSRVDLTWSYDWSEEEEIRNTRSVLRLSYSQRIVDDFFLSAGLVWANKPEFRGEVDKDFSVQLGIKYKVFQRNDP